MDCRQWLKDNNFKSERYNAYLRAIKQDSANVVAILKREAHSDKRPGTDVSIGSSVAKTCIVSVNGPMQDLSIPQTWDVLAKPISFMQNERVVEGQLWRPPVESVFPVDICHAGWRKCDMVEIAFVCLQDAVNAVYSRVDSSSPMAFDRVQYRRASFESILCLLINGVANGFGNTVSRLDNSMTLYREEHKKNEAGMAHYETMMHNVLVYFFHYGIPRAEWVYYLESVQRKTVETAVHSCKPRLKHKLWSYDFVGVTDSYDSNLGKGHNYHIALLYDRLVPGGIGGYLHKYNPEGGHFLTSDEASTLLSINDGKRLWVKKDVMLMISKLSGK